MNFINKIILAGILIGLTTPSRAEVVSYSGAVLKPSYGAAVSELMGCYFNSYYAPIDIPDDSVIIGITLHTYNLSPEKEFRIIKIFKHFQDTLPQVLMDYSYDVEPGFSSKYIPASLTSPIKVKEFLAFGGASSSQSGICGIKIHYEINLIFKSGFD